MKKGILIFGACLAIAVLVFIFIYNNSNSMYGTYEVYSEITGNQETSKEAIDNRHKLGEKLVVNSDNTASFYPSRNETPLQLTFDDNNFMVVYDGEKEIIPYKYENRKITWTEKNDNGTETITVFKKK